MARSQQSSNLDELSVGEDQTEVNFFTLFCKAVAFSCHLSGH
jgi:hypothetical protein